MEALCVDGLGGRVIQQMLALATAQQQQNNRRTRAEESPKLHPGLFGNLSRAHPQKDVAKNSCMYLPDLSMVNVNQQLKLSIDGANANHGSDTYGAEHPRNNVFKLK